MEVLTSLEHHILLAVLVHVGGDVGHRVGPSDQQGVALLQHEHDPNPITALYHVSRDLPLPVLPTTITTSTQKLATQQTNSWEIWDAVTVLAG
jgi:hypothetical protein